MLKILKNTKSITQLKKGGVRIDNKNRAKHDNEIDRNKVRDDEVAKEKNYQKTFKFKKSVIFGLSYF